MNLRDRELDGINSLVTMMKGTVPKRPFACGYPKVLSISPTAPDKEAENCHAVIRSFAATKLFEEYQAAYASGRRWEGRYLFRRYRLRQELYYAVSGRMLMKSKIFHSPTILIITDAAPIWTTSFLASLWAPKNILGGDETVVSGESREKLREELQGRESERRVFNNHQKFT